MLATLLLLGLASMGIANGLWSKNLVINGEVQTGDLNVDFTSVLCNEYHPWNDNGSLVGTSPGEYLGKNVGSTVGDIDDDDAQILYVTVANGYPSYAVDCTVRWRNTGTIPFNFSGFTINQVSDNLHNCVLTGTQEKRLDCDELTVIYRDGITSQVDPGVTEANSLRIHVEQPSVQGVCTPTGPGATVCTSPVAYEFQVKLCVAQWNEAATFAQCVDSFQHEGPPNGPGDNDGTPYWLDTEGPPGNTNGLDASDDCTDGVDNDGDGFIDGADGGCT
jgi:hypothetical protein